MVLSAPAPIAALEDVMLIALKRDCVIHIHSFQVTELTIPQHRIRTVAQTALRGGGIPLLRGITKKGFLSYQVVAINTEISPKNLSFPLLCNKDAIVYCREFWAALGYKEKENRFT